MPTRGVAGCECLCQKVTVVLVLLHLYVFSGIELGALGLVASTLPLRTILMCGLQTFSLPSRSFEICLPHLFSPPLLPTPLHSSL